MSAASLSRARGLARALCAVAMIASLATIAGCAPIVYGVSTAPPSREGKILKVPTDGTDAITISKGVAIAIECRDPWWGTACDAASASTADPKIARVMPAHLEKMKDPWSMGGYADERASQRAVFVVAGVDAGETSLTIHSDDGDRTFHVTVEP